jgi:hypothetical protein
MEFLPEVMNDSFLKAITPEFLRPTLTSSVDPQTVKVLKIRFGSPRVDPNAHRSQVDDDTHQKFV